MVLSQKYQSTQILTLNFEYNEILKIKEYIYTIYISVLTIFGNKAQNLPCLLGMSYAALISF